MNIKIVSEEYTMEELHLSEEELKAIRERCDAASPGPWHIADCRHQQNGQLKLIGRFDIANILARGKNPDADADFIAHARTDIPALLAEVERLRQGERTKESLRQREHFLSNLLAEKDFELERLRTALAQRTEAQWQAAADEDVLMDENKRLHEENERLRAENAELHAINRQAD